jgi:hypothetical protein
MSSRQTIATIPVRPPAWIPIALSTYVIMLVVPRSAPPTVPMPSTYIAFSIPTTPDSRDRRVVAAG